MPQFQRPDFLTQQPTPEEILAGKVGQAIETLPALWQKHKANRERADIESREMRRKEAYDRVRSQLDLLKLGQAKGYVDPVTNRMVEIPGISGYELQFDDDGIPSLIKGEGATAGFKSIKTPSATAPKGFRYRDDGTLEMIPGGPEDIKAQEKSTKEQMAARSATQKAESVMGAIDQSLEKVGWSTAGLGSYLDFLRGTPARDLKGMIDTVQANLGFDALQKMRAESPTGGALGQVAVRELELLQAQVRSLDRGQSPKILRKNLLDIKKHYETWKDAVNRHNAGEDTLSPEMQADTDPLGIR